jgi:threonine dehydrogenase-like Zn-dependent dehydrogenase
LDQLIALAPAHARIVVVGICMGHDSIEPVIAINKELNLQFVICYAAEEFATTLRNLAEGTLSVNGLITGRTSHERLSNAFEELTSPEAHVKMIVEFG